MIRRTLLVAVAAASLATGQAWASEAPRILATGDSMMLLTDEELKDALANRAHVLSDVRAATGLTKPHLFDWQHYARRQMARRRPDVVVAAMGANEAFAIGRAKCCGRRWSARYSKRVERLAASWRRHGADAVYWLTLPEPVESFITPRVRGVNRAVRAARGIRLVDAYALLTPDGVFHRDMETSPGVVQQVRSDDGVHLWWPGARIVAAQIVRQLEADGVV
ncbi:MAG TPA: hypothetical protein VF587_15275 [Solirubrobacteraceae bacterium]